jgi:hypothetical protein
VVDQALVAQRLASGTPEQQSEAAALVQRLRTEVIRPELRSALINALTRANSAAAERDRAARRGEALTPLYDGEYRSKLLRSIVKLKAPAAIPALAGALGTGGLAFNALADFGDVAAAAVLAAAKSQQSSTAMVHDALIALRFMVESGGKPLSVMNRNAVYQVAMTRLDDKQQDVTLLWQAIDLASAFPDATIRGKVRTLADDAAALTGRNIDASLHAQTRKRAADRAAGVPALPRRKVAG